MNCLQCQVGEAEKIEDLKDGNGNVIGAKYRCKKCGHNFVVYD
jgi:transposase-like protein